MNPPLTTTLLDDALIVLLVFDPLYNYLLELEHVSSAGYEIGGISFFMSAAVIALTAPFKAVSLNPDVIMIGPFHASLKPSRNSANIDAAVAADKKPGFRAISPQVHSRVDLDIQFEIKEKRNVGALLPGTDLKDEVVVLSAHCDHMGFGKPDEIGDEIYNEAAGHAGGIVGGLLAARQFLTLPQAPRRSILFLYPSPEESALDGYFVAAAVAQGRTIFFDDDNSDGWFFRSDHYDFAKKGVPAVIVENGLHPVDPTRVDKYPMSYWYHQPRDKYREDRDLSGTMANIYMLFSVGISLANTAKRPQNGTTRSIVIR